MFWSHPNDSWHLVVKLICTLCRVEAALEQRRQAIVPFSVMYHEPFLNANIPAAIQHICQISPNPRPCSQSKTYVTTGRPYWEHAGWNLTRLQADWPMRRKLIKIAPDRTIFKHGSSGVPEFEQYCPLYPAWPLPVTDKPSRWRLCSSTTECVYERSTRLASLSDRAFSVAPAKLWNIIADDVTTTLPIDDFIWKKLTRIEKYLSRIQFPNYK